MKFSVIILGLKIFGKKEFTNHRHREMKRGLGRRSIDVGLVGISQVLRSIVDTNPNVYPETILLFGSMFRILLPNDVQRMAIFSCFAVMSF